jgi:hypothetical protein
MTTFTATERELKQVARSVGTFEYNARGYILMVWGTSGQHNVRLDLKKWSNDRYQKFVDGGGMQYEYLISSFHVKLRGRITEDAEDFDYLYFVYQGGGVWQPVWGYGKTEQRRGSTPRYESSTDDWNDLLTEGRRFLEALGRATNTSQEMAMGPVQGARSNVSAQL